MSIFGQTAAVLVVIGLLAGACGGDDNDPSDFGGATSTATPLSSPTAELGTATPIATTTPDGQHAASPTGTPATSPTGDQSASAQRSPSAPPPGPSVVLTPVASLPDPIDLAARPGTGSETGDLYIATRAGQVWLLGADGDEPPEMVLDIGHQTTTNCETGLLDIAFDPSGSSLYIHYTDLRGRNQIVEYPMSGHRVEDAEPRTVLSVDQPACNHNGGQIAFGPDGYLWVGLGDGGGSNDRFNHGQNLDSLLATIIRVDAEASADAPYTIPVDNPFAEGGARPEIWVYGARNPWRFSFDRDTDDLWIADVGQNEWEEIHVLRATDGWDPGANLGWPLFEGNERFSGTATPDDLVFPVHVYDHNTGCSITGGHVYRGSAIPELVGTYVFGDLCAGRLWGLTIEDDGVDTREELGVAVPGPTLVSFGEDAAGEIYVLSFDDTVYRLDPAP